MFDKYKADGLDRDILRMLVRVFDENRRNKEVNLILFKENEILRKRLGLSASEIVRADQ